MFPVIRFNLKKVSVLFILLLLSSVLHGKETADYEFIAGKVEFINKNGSEGIIPLSSPGKAYLLNKGVLLVIKRGDKQIVLRITDVQGEHLKCSVNNEAGADRLIYGEDVYYSEVINSGIKYRDAKRILAQLIKLYEEFIFKIESTEDPAVLANTVNSFSSELDKLLPEMKRINSRYPELEKFKLSPPAELLNESAMLEVLEPRLRDAFFKIQMFGSDENVKKATNDLHKVLQKMNAGGR
ncbi:MAG: hypothetical protein CVV49_05220 [Spirochaetae bacterium HGW-Spirochaetae-5]|nr:MAG: hypothetical protein CVV49_05220 [Spirochaetae bacterium HGW-Spirochaetae-5]